MPRRLAIVLNPASGGGRAARALGDVEAELRRLGAETRVATTRSLEHGGELALEALDRGEVPVAFGGDGHVGAIAGVVAGRGDDATLGLLPGGRGNDLVRTLGIPQDPVLACATLTAGAPRPLDLGECNGRTFVGIASCGFDSEANRIANETKVVRGNLVYAYGALRALATWAPAAFTLRLDGREERVSGYSVVAANSRAYGGGMFIAPGAALDDGLLDVVLTGHVSKARFLRNLPKVFKGTHVEEPEVRVLRAAEVEIAADRPFAVYADGERLADLPATVRVRRHALRVLAP